MPKIEQSDKRSITVYVTAGNRKITEIVQAVIVGPFGVYRSVEQNLHKMLPGFVISHLATKLRCPPRVEVEGDAIKVATYLANHFPSFTAQTTADAVGPLPKWVRQWLMACERGLKWIDPDEYKVDGCPTEAEKSKPVPIKNAAPGKLKRLET